MTISTSKPSKIVSSRKSTSKSNLLHKTASCLIPIIPLVIYYNVPLTTVSFDTFLIIIVSLSVILSAFTCGRKIELKECRFYLLLLAWTLIITSIYYFLNYYPVNYGIGLWYIVPVFLIIVGVKNKLVDNHLIIKTYMVISIAAIVLIVFQWIIYFFSNVRLSFMFSFLPFNDAYPFDSYANTPSSFSAFFSERSHFCLYLIPFLCILIKKSIKNSKYLILPVFVTILIVSTTSGNGIIVSVIAWVSTILFSIKGKKRIIFLVFTIFTIVIAYFFLKTIPEFETIFDTLFRNENQFSHSKADYRIYRGFDYWLQLPFFNQLFGIGYRSLSNSFNYYNLIEHFNTSGEYMGCLCQILVYSGVLGFTAFSLFMISLFTNGNALSNSILVCFLAYCLSSSIYFDSIWILYLSIIISINYLLSNKDDKNKNIRRSFYETI